MYIWIGLLVVTLGALVFFFLGWGAFYLPFAGVMAVLTVVAYFGRHRLSRK